MPQSDKMYSHSEHLSDDQSEPVPDTTGIANSSNADRCICIECGYDLRATSMEGNCPECGTDCHRSLWFSSNAARWWRWRVMWGVYFLTAAVIAKLLVDLMWDANVIYYFRYDNLPPWDDGAAWIDWLVKIMLPYLMAIAAILVTVSCPAIWTSSKPFIYNRQIALWCLLCGSVGKILSPLILYKLKDMAYYYSYYRPNIKSTILEGIAAVYPWVIEILYGIGIAAILFYLSSLLFWLAAHKLSRHVRNLTWVVIIFIIATSIWWAARNVIVPSLGRPVVVQSNTTLIFTIVSYIIGWGTLVVMLWGMIVLWRAAIVVGRGLTLRPPVRK